MGLYDQAPQIYGSMLQNGLDKQFQLATQAQPVAQFLAGLRQSQALKAQQAELERQAANDQWNRQKFEETQAWNRERTGIEDDRYRANMELTHQDRAERQAEIKRQNAAEERQAFRNRFSKGSRGGEADFPQWDAAAKAAGLDLRAEGLAEDTTVPEAGPFTEDIPEPTRKVTMLKEGGEWRAMLDAKAEEKRAAEEKRKQSLIDQKALIDYRESRRPRGGAGMAGLPKLSKDQMWVDPNDPSKGVTQIPGSQGEAKVRGMDAKLSATQSKAYSAMSSYDQEMSRLWQNADKLLTHPGLEKVVGWTGVGQSRILTPGSEAQDARILIAQLKAQGGFAALRDMRAASPTGGALGNVSDKEGELLQQQIAALDPTQSLESMREQLKNFKRFTEESMARVKAAYDQQFGGGTAQAPAAGDPDAAEKEALRKAGATEFEIAAAFAARKKKGRR